MERTYQRDHWQIIVGEHANYPSLQVNLTSPSGKRATYYFLHTDDGEAIFDEAPYPEFDGGVLRESKHVRELTAWAVGQYWNERHEAEPEWNV